MNDATNKSKGAIINHKGAGKAKDVPAPADFAQKRVEVGGVLKLAKHYDVYPSVIKRWIRECGLPTSAPIKMKPVPDDFIKQHKNMTQRELVAHYGVSMKTIRKWEAATNTFKEKTLPRFTPPKRAIPDDFARVAGSLTISQLTKHYKSSPGTVKRWIAESQVSPKKWINFGAPKAQPIPLAKQNHEHERAANYLRKYMAVSPCNADGKYEQGGSHYRVGFNVMTREQTIEKARAHQDREMRKILATNLRPSGSCAPASKTKDA